MADEGNGSSVTFKTDAWTAAVTNIQVPGGTRESLETSHLGTVTAKTFMPAALIDAGEVVCTYQYDGALAALPSITGSTSSLVVTVTTNTSTNTFTCDAFVTDVGPIEIANGTIMEGDVTLKLTGVMTHA